MKILKMFSPIFRGLILILIFNLIPLSFGAFKAFDGSQRASEGRPPSPPQSPPPLPAPRPPSRPPVPVYYPPYNPIDMEQFNSMKVLSEIERRIPITLQEALKMVRRQKMQSCVALIICTLACDPKSQGSAGDEAYKQLVHFSHVTANSTNQLTDNQMKDITLFREAEAKGMTHRNHCEECSSDYPKCRKNIEDLLKMFLNFNILD